MTDFTISKSRQRYMVVKSATVASTATVTLTNLPITDFPHVHLSIQWYDINGDQQASTGGAGPQWTVEMQTAGQDDNGWWDSPAVDIIELQALATISWEANTVSVRVTPDSLPDSTVVSWGVTITANRT